MPIKTDEVESIIRNGDSKTLFDMWMDVVDGSFGKADLTVFFRAVDNMVFRNELTKESGDGTGIQVYKRVRKLV